MSSSASWLCHLPNAVDHWALRRVSKTITEYTMHTALNPMPQTRRPESYPPSRGLADIAVVLRMSLPRLGQTNSLKAIRQSLGPFRSQCLNKFDF